MPNQSPVDTCPCSNGSLLTLASDRPPSLCREYPKLHKASFVSEILKDLGAASPTLKLDPLLHHIVRKDIGTGGAG
jgi:hypothetical protein